MAKIIVPIEHYSESMLCLLNELFPNKEKNIFIGIYAIPQDSVIGRTGKWNYGLKDYYIKSESVDKFNIEEMIPEIIKKFEWDAQKLNLDYDIHYTAGLTWEILMEESVFSNLLAVDISKIDLYASLRSVLERKNECPILFYKTNAKIDAFVVPLIKKENVSILRSLNYFLPPVNYIKPITIFSFIPSTSEEARQERYLVEMLRSNYQSVSIQWLLSQNLDIELKEFCMDKNNNLFVFDRRCEASIYVIEMLVEKISNFIFVLI